MTYQPHQSADNLMALLMDAPTASVESIQEAMRRVAAGQWRDAARTLSNVADFYPEGDTFGDRCEKLSAVFRAKA